MSNPPPPLIYTLSLHDALPISVVGLLTDVTVSSKQGTTGAVSSSALAGANFSVTVKPLSGQAKPTIDRKSTRLNSSHVSISYAVFCLKKKTRRVSLPTAADHRR